MAFFVEPLEVLQRERRNKYRLGGVTDYRINTGVKGNRLAGIVADEDGYYFKFPFL